MGGRETRPSSSNENLTGRGRGQQSRSGDVNYGTRNNGIGQTRSPQNWEPAPAVLGSDGRIRREAWNEDRVQQNARFRTGYYAYDQRWTDDSFWYPHYGFSWGRDCVPSPFYGYPHLPGYINTVRVTFSTGSWNWSYGERYSWSYNRWDDDRWGNNDDWWRDDDDRRGNRELDDAIDGLVDGFQRRNIRFIGNLIPTRSRVVVEYENRARYAISSDDFYDMMRDLVEGTRTRSYRIRDVRVGRSDANILAEHEYQDAWGRRQVKRHWYGLRAERRGYAIVSFRVDDRW
jgi:hypothetical protein